MRVRATWAEYEPEERETEEGRRPKQVWIRVARPPVILELPLDLE